MFNENPDYPTGDPRFAAQFTGYQQRSQNMYFDGTRFHSDNNGYAAPNPFASNSRRMSDLELKKYEQEHHLNESGIRSNTENVVNSPWSKNVKPMTPAQPSQYSNDYGYTSTYKQYKPVGNPFAKAYTENGLNNSLIPHIDWNSEQANAPTFQGNSQIQSPFASNPEPQSNTLSWSDAVNRYWSGR